MTYCLSCSKKEESDNPLGWHKISWWVSDDGYSEQQYHSFLCPDCKEIRDEQERKYLAKYPWKVSQKK